MEGQKPKSYWSVYRLNASGRGGDGTSALSPVAVLSEIEQAIRNAFPIASKVTAQADVSDVLVKFVNGQKTILVRFTDETLRTYARCSEASRQQALKTLRFVCSLAFAREYAPDDDPTLPMIIDGAMVLSNTLY